MNPREKKYETPSLALEKKPFLLTGHGGIPPKSARKKKLLTRNRQQNGRNTGCGICKIASGLYGETVLFSNRGVLQLQTILRKEAQRARLWKNTRYRRKNDTENDPLVSESKKGQRPS